MSSTDDPQRSVQIPAHRYVSGEWVQDDDAPPRRDADQAESLTIVTWNIWFGRWRRDDRLAALIDIALDCDPDVIALQEVTDPTLGALTELEPLRRDFWISDVDGATFDAHYGVWLATRRFPCALTWRPLPSQMGRGVLTLDLGPLTVSTVHLESTRSCAPVRRTQLEIIDAALDGSRPRLLVGDMNFDDGAAERRALASDWVDAIDAVEDSPTDVPTIDSELNHMRHVTHPGRSDRAPIRKRLDRVFVRGSAWRVTSLKRLGTTSLPDDPLTFPSDHFGLCAQLERVAGRSRD